MRTIAATYAFFTDYSFDYSLITQPRKALALQESKKRETGFEPATLALARRYSTTEPLVHLSVVSNRTIVIILIYILFVNHFFYFFLTFFLAILDIAILRALNQLPSLAPTFAIPQHSSLELIIDLF